MMALVFSPLSEDVLEAPPRRLYPATGFVMRQIGSPPDIDREMVGLVRDGLAAGGFQLIDAAETVGSKDYLERILGLIRATGFTVAVFSEQTRPSAMANIALELGFAAMCGKPLVIVKSRAATAPSDLTRTDWIEHDPDRPGDLTVRLRQAAANLVELAGWERSLLEQSLGARRMDCAVAFERAVKGFLLSGDRWFVDAANQILTRLVAAVDDGIEISDLDRVRRDVEVFIGQARGTIA